MWRSTVIRGPWRNVSLLDVQSVSVRFGGIHALDRLSFTIDEGQICGLIGPNGAGKTTMFNVVSRIYQPSRAACCSRATTCSACPPTASPATASPARSRTWRCSPEHDAARERDGRRPLPGQSGVCPLGAADRDSCEERRIRGEAGDLLARLGLAHLAHRPAAGLPFGTLKRLELARALAAKPTFLLMDEPASGLTHGEVDELGELIMSIRNEFG